MTTVILDPIIAYAVAVILAYFISVFSIPSIIKVAKRRLLFDEPDKVRKLHTISTSNLGGIAIFLCIAFVTTLFAGSNNIPSWNYIFASSILLFVTGLKDDIIILSPVKKFAAQFLAAFIVVCFAGIRLYEFHGFLGIHRLPEWFSIAFSVIGIMFVTNAFNLIDGIDGLAGGLSLFIFSFYGIYFALIHNGLAFLAFSLVGAIAGFLYYNISPARIFMGDTGSLLLGFLAAVFSIKYVNAASHVHYIGQQGQSALIIAVAMLIIPVFDTLRVFIQRIVQGRSPFKADRNHIHHILISTGLSHTSASIVLLTAQVFLLGIAVLLKDADPTLTIFVLFAVFTGLFQVARYRRKKLDMRGFYISLSAPPAIKSPAYAYEKHPDDELGNKPSKDPVICEEAAEEVGR